MLIEIHTFFIQEKAFENVVCEIAAILPRPQCVKSIWQELVIDEVNDPHGLENRRPAITQTKAVK